MAGGLHDFLSSSGPPQNIDDRRLDPDEFDPALWLPGVATPEQALQKLMAPGPHPMPPPLGLAHAGDPETMQAATASHARSVLGDATAPRMETASIGLAPDAPRAMAHAKLVAGSAAVEKE